MEIEEAKPAVIISGDFNGVSLTATLPLYMQCVNFSTRGANCLDLFYCNMKNAFIVKSLPPIGNSDHLMLHALPTYVRKLKREKPCTKTIQVWNQEVEEELSGCFACTDWEMFVESCSDINELTDTVTEYIKFCEDNVVPRKKIKIYPNNRP